MAYCAAIGDPVCLVDDDVEPPSGWLRALTGAALDHPEIGCVGGPMLLRLDWVAPTKCEGEAVGESELDLGDRTFEVRYVWGGNMAVRRHAVDKVGMFQEHRRCGNDEVEWMDRLHQAGLSVLYVGSAPVIHRRVADDLRLGHLARRRFLRGMGQSAAYYQAGYAYRVEAQWAGLRERSGHAADHRCTTSALEASQLAGRLVALAALRLRDRVRGRTITLAQPPG